MNQAGTKREEAQGVTPLLQQAVALHQKGQLQEAGQLYRQVLALAPRQFDALHLLGVIARQQGDAAGAVELIGQAIALKPDQANAHCNLGAALQDLGRSEAALASYETALRLHPHYAMAYANRGNALRKLGRMREAVESYGRALALQPRYPEAACNRAAALLELGEPEAALASAELALAGQPRYAQALCVRANALYLLRRLRDALAGYDAALALDATMAEAHAGRAMTLHRLRRFDEALRAHDQALALRPAHAATREHRAATLAALGRREEAILAYQAAQCMLEEQGADGSRIGFALAALGVGETPERAPQEYVKALFDQYAGHFDQHLTEVLDYRTPEAIAAALESAQAPLDGDVLDLGCGTGLCAPHLRPRARSLAGVDLSERMLDKARASGLYDRLACADVTAFLAREHAAFDLIVAADVFVYFGELAEVFALARRALRPGGAFCFSTETVEGEGFALLPSNRYAHSAAYLRALARAQGFEIALLAPAPLRSENGVPIVGQVAVLRLAAGAA